MTQQTQDVIEVTTHTVACDGGNAALGHPRVYLHLDGDSHAATCPYCGKHFVVRGHKH